MFILKNNNIFKKKINDFFSNNYREKLDEITIYSLKILNKEISVSKIIENTAIKHLIYLYKEKTDLSFKFTFRVDISKKFKYFLKLLEKKRDIKFNKHRLFLIYFTFGWVYKNNKNNFMIKRLLDLTSNKDEKEKFWSLVMIWASFDLFGEKETNVIISGPNKIKNNKLYSMILNYVSTMSEINKNFVKWDQKSIVSSWLGTIKTKKLNSLTNNEKNTNFAYFNQFHDFENNKQFSKLENLNIKMIVYDGLYNQNIETLCSYFILKYKFKLEKQISNIDIDSDDCKTLIWDSNKNANYEIFYNKEKKSQLYYSLFSNTNKRMKKYITDYLKSDFRQQKTILGIEYNSSNELSISLMFVAKFKTYRKALVFKNFTFISKKFLNSKKHYIKKNYEEWIKEQHIIVSGEATINFREIYNFFLGIKEKYKVAKVVYKNFNLSTKSLIYDFILKNKIFDKDVIYSVKKDIDVWECLQIFQGKLFNKEIYLLNGDFMFKQFLNFETRQTNENWEIRRISTLFPWANLFSSLICISQKKYLEEDKKMECLCYE